MADQVIRFSGDFEAMVQNYKRALQDMEKDAGKLKVGTNIAKDIEGQLKQAKTLMSKTEKTVNTGVSSRSQYETTITDLQKMENLLNNIQTSFSKVDPSQINFNSPAFGEMSSQLENLKTQLAAVQQEKAALGNLSVGQVLQNAGLSKDLMGKSNTNKGALEFLDQLIAKQEQARQKQAELNAELALKQNDLAAAQAQQASTATNAQLYGLYSDAGKSSLTNQSLYNSLVGFVDKNAQAGTLQSDHVQRALQMAGLDDATVQQIIAAGTNAAARVREALNSQFGNHQQENNKLTGLKSTFLGNFKESGVTKDDQKAHTEAQNKIQQLEEQVKTLQQQLSTANARAAKADKNVATMGGAINSGTNLGELQNRVTNLETAIRNLQNQMAQNVQNQNGGKNPPPPPSGDATVEKGLTQKDAAAQMNNAINMMANRWVSTYAIINKVRQGIRQAWNDIKGLDSAMTNIAVVTSMSTDELWGKIGDYMSIAQQYGVTTQGVYEVSQIYYQQGLGESDVMAATTETLKMARIAGMDYADAADAMTVAIRSFKMEMTDAQRVTDVYSKVASSTASDSEELAIAMSKTASSAESVGSSFENTTAMLAVMIETTRESAQNLGSALKSIISRYGEMKTGATVDEDGEAIAFNKVDTALQSIGISIKDAQGQFRDFDDVIFELSEKWDSLDKNTQRYIATIMAGNRQQSRFIALVDNWERLDEVSGIAENSEDAGLIQYSKTLDSLDAKISNLKTSFQELYMGVANGPAFKGILDFINNVLQGFTKFQGSLLTFIPSIIVAIKGLFSLIKALSTTMFSGIYANATNSMNSISQASIQIHRQTESTNTETTIAETETRKNAQIAANQQVAGQSQTTVKGRSFAAGSKAAGIGGAVLSMAGAGLQMYGANVIGQGGSENLIKGSYMNIGGSALSGAGMGLMMGGPWGALIGAISGLAVGILSLGDSLSELNLAKADQEAAQKEAEESKLKAVEAKNKVSDLESGIAKIRELEKDRFTSPEAMKEWQEANSALVEKFPELTAAFDEAGNAIVDLASAESALTAARIKAAYASRKSAKDDYDKAKADLVVAQATETEWLNKKGESLTRQGGLSERSEKLFVSQVTGEANNLIRFMMENPERFWSDQELSGEGGKIARFIADYAGEDTDAIAAAYARIFKNYTGTDDEGAIQQTLQLIPGLSKEPTVDNLENFLIDTYGSVMEHALTAKIPTTYAGQYLWNDVVSAASGGKFNPLNGTNLYDPRIQELFTSNNEAIDSRIFDLGDENTLALVKRLEESVTPLSDIMALIQSGELSLDGQSKYKFKEGGGDILAQRVLGKNDATFSDLLIDYNEMYADIESNKRIVESSRLNQATIHAQTYMDLEHMGAEWRDMSGANSIITQMARERFASSGVTEFDAFVGSLNTELTGWTQAFADFHGNLRITGKLDEFNAAFQDVQSGVLDWQDFMLGQFDISGDILEEAQTIKSRADLEQFLNNDKKMSTAQWAYYQAAVKEDITQRQYALGGVFSDIGGLIDSKTGLQMDSYDQWREGHTLVKGYTVQDNDVNRNIYMARRKDAIETATAELMSSYGMDTVSEEGLDLKKQLVDFFTTAAPAVVQEYSNLMQQDAELIAKGGAGAAAARERRASVTKLWAEVMNSETLPEEAQAAFVTAMTTDYGTIEWERAVEEWIAEYGQDLSNVELSAYENFTIRAQYIADQIGGVSEAIDDIVNKHSKGFKWEDATKLLEDARLTDPSLSMQDLFEVDTDGVLRLKDAVSTIRQQSQSIMADLDDQMDQIENITGSINSTFSGGGGGGGQLTQETIDLATTNYRKRVEDSFQGLNKDNWLTHAVNKTIRARANNTQIGTISEITLSEGQDQDLGIARSLGIVTDQQIQSIQSGELSSLTIDPTDIHSLNTDATQAHMQATWLAQQQGLDDNKGYVSHLAEKIKAGAVLSFQDVTDIAVNYFKGLPSEISAILTELNVDDTTRSEIEKKWGYSITTVKQLVDEIVDSVFGNLKDGTSVDTILGAEGQSAQEKARIIGEALKLNDSQIGELAKGIESGAINSLETLKQFYQKLYEDTQMAKDVIQKQYEAAVKEQTFASWLDTKGYSKASGAKKLASGGTVEDLKDIWFENVADQDLGTWEYRELRKLTEEDLLKIAKNHGLNVSSAAEARVQLTGTKTLLEDWSEADWDNFYDAQAASMAGAKIGADGKIEITDAEAWTDYITTEKGITDQATKNEIYAAAQAQVEAQAEEIKKRPGEFGANVFSGKNVLSSAATLFKDAESIKPEDIDSYNFGGLLTQAIEADGEEYTGTELYNLFKQQVSAEILEGADFKSVEEEAKRRYDETVSAYHDAQQEALLSYIDLSAKAIEGELTAEQLAEKAELEAQLGPDIITGAFTKWAGTVAEQYQNLLLGIAEQSSNLPWDKIEKTVEQGFETIVGDALATAKGFSSKDQSELISNIEETEGVFSEDDITDTLVSAYKTADATGREALMANSADFINAFQWDDEIEGWYIADMEKIATIFGTDTKEYAAFLHAQNQYLATKAVKRDDLNREYEGTLTEMVGDLESVTLEKMISAYESLFGEGSFADSGMLNQYEEAIKEAQNGNVELLRNHIIELASAAAAQGYDVDISALAAAIEDAEKALLDELISFVQSGIEGTLGHAEYQAMAERYGLSQGIETANGMMLTGEDQKRMIGTIYAEARNSGSLLGIGERLAEILPKDATFDNLDNAIAEARSAAETAQSELSRQQGVLKNAQLAAARGSEEARMALEPQKNLTEEAQKTADAAWDYVRALEAAQAALMLDAEAYDFTFMNQDPTDGMTANFDNFLTQLETVKTVFDNFSAGESIEYKQWFNMMDFLNEQGQWDNFAAHMTNAEMSYETFVNSVVENTDEWGKVNIAGVAAEMGISVEAATAAMTEGMSEGLKAVAKEQINYLTGLEKMLEAMIALEGLDVNAKISFETEYTDEKGNKLDGLQGIWEYYKNLPPEQKKTFLTEVKFTGEGSDNAQALWNAFTSDGDLTEQEYTIMVGIQTKWNEMDSTARGQLLKNLSSLSQEQFAWLAESATKADGSIDMELLFANMLDPQKIRSSFGLLLQQAFAGAGNEISFKGTTYTITGLDGNDFVVENVPSNWVAEQLQKQLSEQLEEVGLQIDNFVFDGNKATYTVKPLDKKVTEMVRQGIFQPNEQGVNTYTVEAGKGTTITLTYDNAKIIVEQPDSGKLEETRQAIAEAYHVSADKVALTEIEAGTGKYSVDIDFSAQTDPLVLMQTTLQSIHDMISSGLDITVDNAAAKTAIQEVQTLLASLSDKTLTVTVNYQQGQLSLPSGSSIPSNNGTPTIPKGPGNATGNVNGIALADGNMDNLISGAHLANKTLVGELGPELAVYDGQYHMLGVNGAEFTNLPSDAIVFNHLQTEGILKGQWGHRGKALAEGNVSGPAMASGGASAALAAVKRAKAIWQGLLDDLTAADLVSAAGGGGGGGGGVTNHTGDLQEWYNLSRQIANVEQEINNLLAERENLTEGDAYLRNLREQQKLLLQQANTQEVLLGYQQLQLKRQADAINQNELWSQFLVVDENGLLQYTKGNELNGGKGALDVLAEMNKMSGKDQVAFLKKIGYSYTDPDGKKLKDTELVQKFYEELQKQIDEYDALYDTVHETEETLESLETEVNKINEEIRQNQMDLEKEIYDAIVDAWEKSIEDMQEQNELVAQANEKYISGLNEALSKEKELYSQNENVAEREALQRRLSLLRRSGGSASEIADLESQLDDKLRDEYFSSQEDMIKDITEANERQVQLMEQQVQLQQEALEYQKENGVIWTQVYDVMSRSAEDILAFIQGKSSDFFSQSALQQEDMLLEWAKKIGIYTEDRQYQNHDKYVREKIWDNGNIYNDDQLKNLQGAYQALDADRQGKLQDYFASVYANSRIEGLDEAAARQKAIEALKKQTVDYSNEQAAENRPDTPINGGGSSGGNKGGGSGSGDYLTVRYVVEPSEAKTAGCNITGPARIAVGRGAGTTVTTAKGWIRGVMTSSNPETASISMKTITAHRKGSVVITQAFYKATNENYEQTKSPLSDEQKTNENGSLTETFKNKGGYRIINTNNNSANFSSGERFLDVNAARKEASAKVTELRQKGHTKATYQLYGFSQGGLVDYTGLAMVHGSKSKPESFLNAEQTAQIKEALALSGNNSFANLVSSIRQLDSNIKSVISNSYHDDSSDFTVAPGAVVVQVAKLNDAYDIEDISNDIMNRITTIASKATNRGVNRR